MTSPIAALFKLTPQEAVEYLQGRGQLAQTFDWRDVWQEEHAHQFTVSRLANLDILEAMRDGILASVKGDSSRRDWTKHAREILQQAGWWGKKEVLDPATGEMVTTTFDPARLKLIFDTNTRMAYSAGLWQRIERNKKSHPYIRYITKRDEKVRELHRSWDNLTLPVDHPFWKTHFPPNGWRCRCRAMSISQAEYDKGLSPLGETLNKTAPDVQYRDWLNKRTGVVERVPVGIDPGFGYNPGMRVPGQESLGARAENMVQVETAKLAAAAPAMVAEYRATSELAQRAEAFVSQALASRSAKQAALPLAAVPEAFSAIADKIGGVRTTGKQMALAHDNTLHVMDGHGIPEEALRAQVPIVASDFIVVAEALDYVRSVSVGDPAEWRGVRRIEIKLNAAGYGYTIVFEVWRRYVVPLTMWKVLL